MNILIVEDDFFSRVLLNEILIGYGSVHPAANGQEALEAFEAAMSSERYYQLVCLDIVLPDIDGHVVLKRLREIEQRHLSKLPGTCKILMTTSLNDPSNVMQSFREQADGYLVKPFDERKLVKYLKDFGLLSVPPAGAGN
ncbi:MAG: response regulator [Deltaproteobacteria bacterium]|nr:response regulator [Deltaproteobacteria bacterium]MBN2670942.1 response regulator [Deltaproteobacteria bacterium]